MCGAAVCRTAIENFLRPDPSELPDDLEVRGHRALRHRVEGGVVVVCIQSREGISGVGWGAATGDCSWVLQQDTGAQGDRGWVCSPGLAGACIYVGTPCSDPAAMAGWIFFAWWCRCPPGMA